MWEVGDGGIEGEIGVVCCGMISPGWGEQSRGRKVRKK